MSNPGVRKHYSEMARERMNEFRIERITAQFWTVFDKVIAGKAVRGRDR